MQETRVTQTGAQFLTGFLLTVPFSSRFDVLDDGRRLVYLALLGGSVLTTGLVVAPVAFHRILFRQRRREILVESASRLALLGLVALLATTCGVVFLAVDLVLGRAAAFAGSGTAAFLLVALWVATAPGARAPRRLPPGPSARRRVGRPGSRQ
jgi:hypothetical protein